MILLYFLLYINENYICIYLIHMSFIIENSVLMFNLFRLYHIYQTYWYKITIINNLYPLLYRFFA